MQNRKMKKVVAIMMVAATIGIISGCGKKEEKSEVTTTVTDTQESDVTVNEAAIDQVFNHIEVNGVHVDFPFSLNDLGDDYDFANYVDMGDGTFGMDLEYKGEKIATAYVVANKMNDIDRKSEIISIQINASNMQLIKVKGINCDSSVDEAMNSLNELCKNYDDNGLLINIKYSDNDYYAGIFISEGEKITGIYFNKKINQKH